MTTFTGNTLPSNPAVGDIWVTDGGAIREYVTLSGINRWTQKVKTNLAGSGSVNNITNITERFLVTISADAPSNPEEGQPWYETDTDTMWLYTNGAWIEWPNAGGGSSGVVASRWESGFTGYFDGQQYTIPHGLGVTPDFVNVQARCKIANGGYSVGDVIQVATMADPAGSSEGVSIVVNETQIYVSFGSNGFTEYNYKISGGGYVLKLQDWDINFIAFKFAEDGATLTAPETIYQTATQTEKNALSGSENVLVEINGEFKKVDMASLPIGGSGGSAPNNSNPPSYFEDGGGDGSLTTGQWGPNDKYFVQRRGFAGTWSYYELSGSGTFSVNNAASGGSMGIATGTASGPLSIPGTPTLQFANRSRSFGQDTSGNGEINYTDLYYLIGV